MKKQYHYPQTEVLPLLSSNATMINWSTGPLNPF